jgi:hypothetical protein
MVHVIGDDKFIRDQHIAFVPKFIKHTADDSFILFRHGGSPFKKFEGPRRTWRAESQGGLKLLASCEWGLYVGQEILLRARE